MNSPRIPESRDFEEEMRRFDEWDARLSRLLIFTLGMVAGVVLTALLSGISPL